MKKFFKLFLTYFISLVFLEFVYKTQVLNTVFDLGLVYMSLFSCIYALLLTVISVSLPKKLGRVFNIIVYIFNTILFIGEAMFTYIIGSTFSMYSLHLANQAFDFRKILFESMAEKWYVILLFLLPLIIFIIIRKKVVEHIELKRSLFYIIPVAIIYLITIFAISLDKNEAFSAYNLYYKQHVPSVTVNKFGLITGFRLDLTRYIFGFEEELTMDINSKGNQNNTGNDKVEEVTYNKLNLNFDSIDDKISSYLSSREASNKNEYTGIFKGKSIIYILGESFNSIAVQKDITPTLYKLVNSSFVFTNYYSPMFMSTSGGEFQLSTSLIPTQKTLNNWQKGKVELSYAVGNVFNDLGYDTFAYHNWTYTYYGRNKTMPTLGFNNFLGCGNGLQKKVNCRVWPPSDIEMMNATIDDYINKDHFAVYYVTVSGHSSYSTNDNSMAYKNRNLVANLPYSAPAKAYLATQIELDRALGVLLNRLEEAGKLDDVVIVLSGDHYPYKLTNSEINELSTYTRDSLFEVNSSNLILYNSGIETKTIDKLSSSVDVLPTILNMFGYDYDSRLLMGTDIMSNHDSLVVFHDNSWITEKGRYNATKDRFIANDGITVEEDYINSISKEVQNRIIASDNIIASNYYKKILQK